MYFFVPYNISPIQQAIQAGHAVEQYAHNHGDQPEYIDYVENWKTWIILNGGTTNKTRDLDGVSQGTLNQIADQLSLGDGIAGPTKMAYFEEPDLNDALTAVCFLASERVFNYEEYPDFHDWIQTQDIVDEDEKLLTFTNLRSKTYEELRGMFPGMFKVWVKEVMWSEENVFLRNLLKGKKLA